MTFTTMGGEEPTNPDSCSYNTGVAGAPVFLVGDSNAAQYSEAAIGASTSLDRPLVMATAGGCPFMDVFLETNRPAASDSACRSYYESTFKRVADEPPGTVIIAASSGYWFGLGGRMAIGTTPANITDDSAARAENLESGLGSTVKGLQEAGHQVVLVSPLYWFDDPSTPVNPELCSTLSLWSRHCPVKVDVSEADPLQQEARSAFARVSQMTGSPLIDVRKYQCPRDVCGTQFNDIPLYRDPGHISVQFSRYLRRDFIRALTSPTAS